MPSQPPPLQRGPGCGAVLARGVHQGPAPVLEGEKGRLMTPFESVPVCGDFFRLRTGSLLQLLGHAPKTVTSRIYSHGSGVARLAEAVERLDASPVRALVERIEPEPIR